MTIAVTAVNFKTRIYRNIEDLARNFNPFEPLQNFFYYDIENKRWISHFDISLAKRTIEYKTIFNGTPSE